MSLYTDMIQFLGGFPQIAQQPAALPWPTGFGLATVLWDQSHVDQLISNPGAGALLQFNQPRGGIFLYKFTLVRNGANNGLIELRKVPRPGATFFVIDTWFLSASKPNIDESVGLVSITGDTGSDPAFQVASKDPLAATNLHFSLFIKLLSPKAGSIGQS